MELSELRYEAPLATFDMDEWNDFLDLRSTDGSTEEPNHNCPITDTRTRESVTDLFDDVSFSGSLEDLVNTFDEKITKCFRNYNDKVDSFAPVQARSAEDIVNDTQGWWTLTANYGGSIPINWTGNTDQILDNTTNHGPDYNDSSVHTAGCKRKDCDDAHSSDAETEGDEEEEMSESSDDEDNTTSYVDQEQEDDDDDRIETADEVISELEHMLDSPYKLSRCGGMRVLSQSVSAELREYAQRLMTQNTSIEDDRAGLCKLSLRALQELSKELDLCIREHSEILVEELAMRDDLEYEKELKNRFICLLLAVQKRRRDAVLAAQHTTSKRQRVTANGNYLTTHHQQATDRKSVV